MVFWARKDMEDLLDIYAGSRTWRAHWMLTAAKSAFGAGYQGYGKVVGCTIF